MKEYIKLYQKMREDYYQKWGNYSHPENLTDFEKLNQQIFEEHLKNIWKENEKVEFKGKSHDEITRIRYVKED